jgi:hypothetical protein
VSVLITPVSRGEKYGSSKSIKVRSEELGESMVAKWTVALSYKLLGIYSRLSWWRLSD